MNLFAYGTLMLPEVFAAVTGKRQEGAPATLGGHGRYRVRGRPYPGITPSPGDRSEGVLYGEVDEACWPLLDRFEGDLYERRRVEVATAAGALEAFAYVVPSARQDALTGEPWDLETFRRLDLAAFLAFVRSSFERTPPAIHGPGDYPGSLG